MSGIEDLRRRVQEAEERFGLAHEQQAKYSERLIDLIDAVEGRLREQQAEIETYKSSLASQAEAIASDQAQTERTSHENEQLREMLHSLLSAIESGGRNGLAETMRLLDQKVSTLITSAEDAETLTVDSTDDSEPASLLNAPPETLELGGEAAVEAFPEESAAAEPIFEDEPQAIGESADAEPAPESDPSTERSLQAALDAAAAQPAEVAPETETDATVTALQEVARELAAVPGGDSGAVSDSLRDIMDRVSKLVDETEHARPAEDEPLPAADEAQPAKRTAVS